MWVQLKTVKQLTVNGKPKKFHIGDWVNVSKQTATYWISTGQAHIPNSDLTGLVDTTAGMLYLSEQYKSVGDKLELDTKPFLGNLEYSENLIVGCNPTRTLVPIGFNLLKTWQVCTPLLSYDRLAVHLANENDKEVLSKHLLDLRVPVFNTNLIFIRRSKETQDFIGLWLHNDSLLSNTHLSFLMAFYQTKVTINALPTGWIE